MKKGFTLVELLSIIVILAVILVIAIPQIMNTIKASRISSIKDSAILIAEQAEKDYISNQVLDKDYDIKSIPCSDVAKLNEDYKSCSITYNNGIATVKLVGDDNGKFAGITCIGTKDNMECKNNEVLYKAITNLVEGYDKNSLKIIRVNSEAISCTNTFRYDNTSENNLRYVGESPCNYIYFNCDDYSNANSSTCELWRIVSLNDGYVKLVRNESLGTYSWDSSRNDEPDPSSGRIDVNGFNDWRYADLMKTLNEGYSTNETKNNRGNIYTANNSLYWDRKDGLCSVGNSNDLSACNYSNSGLKELTKDYIENATWHTGGTEYISYNVTGYGNSTTIFERERSNRTWTGRESTWTGKVGLLYPSDYVYASSDNSCLTSYPHSWNTTDNAACLNNYLNKGVDYWTIQPLYKNHHYVLYINSNGQLKDLNASKSFNIYPSIYLKKDVILKSGNGSIENPYQIIL